MKVTIDIPEEFVPEYKDDKFWDSLERLKHDAHLLTGNFEKELTDMLIKAFKDSKEEDTPKSPTPPHPRWMPKEKQIYYTVLYSCGKIDMLNWSSEYAAHKDRFRMGNVYKTRAEAEFVAERSKVLAEMQEWAGNYNDKYFLFYDVNEERIRYLPATEKTVYGEMRFATNEDAKNCIEVVGADRIKKYYFMVPEDEK